MVTDLQDKLPSLSWSQAGVNCLSLVRVTSLRLFTELAFLNGPQLLFQCSNFWVRWDLSFKKITIKKKHCLLAVRLSFSPDTFWTLSRRQQTSRIPRNMGQRCECAGQSDGPLWHSATQAKKQNKKKLWRLQLQCQQPGECQPLITSLHSNWGQLDRPLLRVNTLKVCRQESFFGDVVGPSSS